MSEQAFFILLDNVFAGIAAFLAIVVWVKTREISWIFIVLSVIGFYVAATYRTLLFFGITVSSIYTDAAFNYMPIILMVVALTLKVVKNMRR